MTWATAAWALWLSIAGAEPGAEVRCPESVGVSEQLAAPVAGWTEGRGREPHRLAGITVYDGKPEEQASLVGTERPLSKTRLRVTWTFAPSREYWLSCSYASTGVVLSRRIPPAIRSCSVTYARNVRVAGLPEIVGMKCR